MTHLGLRAMRRRLLLAPLALALAAAGCGGDSSQATKPTLKTSSKLVDKTKTPYVNALELAPDGDFLMTTNTGFYKIAKDGSEVEPVRGATVRASEGTSPVGKFLEIFDAGNGELLGSGHPDDEDALPPFLGFMRSNDGGKTWNVVSRLGQADLHVIRRVGSRLYAFDAVLGAVLISEDGGRTFAERFTPKELVLDIAVDPKDPEYILASTERVIYRSDNDGRSWRAMGDAPAARMAWLDSGELYRGTQDGKWSVSKDRGETWEELGELPGEPYKVRAVDAKVIHVALADASIASTDDGGATWRVTFRAS